MEIKSVKELLGGKSIAKATTEELEDALNELENLNNQDEEGEEIELDDKGKKRLYNNKSRLKKELEERKVNKKDKEFLNNETLSTNDKEKLIEQFISINKQAKGDVIEREELEELNENELLKLISNRTELVFRGSDNAANTLATMMFLTTRLVEYGGNFISEDDNNILEGYSKKCVQQKENVIECLKEIIKDRPEVLNYLTPATRLFFIFAYPAVDCVAVNTFKNNFRRDISIQDNEDDNFDVNSNVEPQNM